MDYGYALEDEGKEIAKNHEWWFKARREHLEKMKKAKAVMEEEINEIKMGSDIKQGLEIKTEL